MAYENVISDAVLSKTHTYGGSDIDAAATGDDAKATDGNDSTYAWSYARGDTGEWFFSDAWNKQIWTYTFSAPVVKTDRIKIKAGFGADVTHRGDSAVTYLKYSVVSDEGTTEVYYSGNTNGYALIHTYEANTVFNNVTKIIVEAKGQNDWMSYRYAYCMLYEVFLGGVYYVDKNIRFRSGGATIKAACHVDLSSNPKLRMRSGGETVGLVLVDVTDDNASKLRIKTSAGIKAIAQLS